MTYAGLRGAIGLSLALYVKNSTFVAPHIDQNNFKDFKILTILYVAFTILWTVLVNGLTIKYIIIGIGFVKKGILFDKMKLLAKEQLNTLSVQKIHEMQSDSKYKYANWDVIYTLIKLQENTKYVMR